MDSSKFSFISLESFLYPFSNLFFGPILIFFILFVLIFVSVLTLHILYFLFLYILQLSFYIFIPWVPLGCICINHKEFFSNLGYLILEFISILSSFETTLRNRVFLGFSRIIITVFFLVVVVYRTILMNVKSSLFYSCRSVFFVW